MGLSERAIVLLYWGFCALFGLLALIVSSRFHKMLALATIGAVVIVVLAFLSREPET
jgi:uncharacterized membrane protein